jgi:hypothetical protein
MEMYEQCIKANPFLSDVEKVIFDNRSNNIGISERYNSFLDSYNYTNNAWFVFCHEDFQLLSSLADSLIEADQATIYGPTGTKTRRWCKWLFCGYYQSAMLGRIRQSRKDGTCLAEFGQEVPQGTIVELLDCQCLVVHSSLVAKYKLRFDNQFEFHCYAEDFCATAIEEYGIQSAILPLQCQHWSPGNISSGYAEAAHSFNMKHPRAAYSAPVSLVLGGGVPWNWRLQVKALNFINQKYPHTTQILKKFFLALSQH